MTRSRKNHGNFILRPKLAGREWELIIKGTGNTRFSPLPPAPKYNATPGNSDLL